MGEGPLSLSQPCFDVFWCAAVLTDETAQIGEQIFHKLKCFLINKDGCCGDRVDTHRLCFGVVDTEPNFSGKVAQTISFWPACCMLLVA